jgi:peptidoglycan/LPS O-acetylase OafA/YrhL
MCRLNPPTPTTHCHCPVAMTSPEPIASTSTSDPSLPAPDDRKTPLAITMLVALVATASLWDFSSFVLRYMKSPLWTSGWQIAGACASFMLTMTFIIAIWRLKKWGALGFIILILLKGLLAVALVVAGEVETNGPWSLVMVLVGVACITVLTHYWEEMS